MLQWLQRAKCDSIAKQVMIQFCYGYATYSGCGCSYMYIQAGQIALCITCTHAYICTYHSVVLIPPGQLLIHSYVLVATCTVLAEVK